MRILAVLAFAALLGFPCAGQSFAMQDTTTYEYGEIMGTKRAINLTKLKMNVEFNFGGERKFGDSERWKDSETGKLIQFNTMADAMNFLAVDGWQFLGVYTVPFTESQSEVHFVVRRPKYRSVSK